MYTLPIERIQETTTYKELIARKETIKASFLTKKNIRETITNGFEIYKNTGVIPSHIVGNNLKIIKDLIEIETINISKYEVK